MAADPAVAALPFKRIWVVDTEYQALDGEALKAVHCLCGLELRSGRRLALWHDQFNPGRPPFDIGPDSLFVVFSAAADMGAFLAIGWPLPARVFDCYAEGLNVTNNGAGRLFKTSLVGMSQTFGGTHRLAEEKPERRKLAMDGEPYTPRQRRELLEYCMEDVDTTAHLFRALLPHALARGGLTPIQNLRFALYRGRYGEDVAKIERSGVPVNRPLLLDLQRHWKAIRAELVREANRRYGFWEGTTLKLARLKSYIKRYNLAGVWPLTDGGAPRTDQDTLRGLAQRFPQLRLFYEVRTSSGEFRLTSLKADEDGRHHFPVMPFVSKTGRNQPPASRCIFGPARWMRHLIAPKPGNVLAYLDYAAQEICIAAALSGDPAMMADYASGDPYLGYAIRVGDAPPGATKATHGPLREQFKVVKLGINYGMGAEGLARDINRPAHEARRLLAEHDRLYPRFKEWQDCAVAICQMGKVLMTGFGWGIQGPVPNPRTARNFLMQATGAEILRLAVAKVLDAGISICVPVHDALLIEVEEAHAAERIEQAALLMKEASRIALKGFTCRVDGRSPDAWVRPGAHYVEPRAAEMWQTVLKLLERVKAREAEGE